MELNILERVLIYFSLLPKTGDLLTIRLVKSIKKKIELTNEEQSLGIVLDKDMNGDIYIKYISEDALNCIKCIDLSEKELKLITNYCKVLDSNKQITEANIDLIEKFLNEDI